MYSESLLYHHQEPIEDSSPEEFTDIFSGHTALDSDHLPSISTSLNATSM